MAEQFDSSLDLIQSARAYELMDVGAESPYERLVADIGEKVAEFLEGSKGFSVFVDNNPRAAQVVLDILGCNTLGHTGPAILAWCQHGGVTKHFGLESLKAISDVPLATAMQLLPAASSIEGDHLLNSRVEVTARARPDRIDGGKMARDDVAIRIAYWHVQDPLTALISEDYELYEQHFGEGTNRLEHAGPRRLSMMAEYDAEFFTPYQNFDIAIFRESEQRFITDSRNPMPRLEQLPVFKVVGDNLLLAPSEDSQ